MNIKDFIRLEKNKVYVATTRNKLLAEKVEIKEDNIIVNPFISTAFAELVMSSRGTNTARLDTLYKKTFLKAGDVAYVADGFYIPTYEYEEMVRIFNSLESKFRFILNNDGRLYIVGDTEKSIPQHYAYYIIDNAEMCYDVVATNSGFIDVLGNSDNNVRRIITNKGVIEREDPSLLAGIQDGYRLFSLLDMLTFRGRFEKEGVVPGTEVPLYDIPFLDEHNRIVFSVMYYLENVYHDPTVLKATEQLRLIFKDAPEEISSPMDLIFAYR